MQTDDRSEDVTISQDQVNGCAEVDLMESDVGANVAIPNIVFALSSSRSKDRSVNELENSSSNNRTIQPNGTRCSIDETCDVKSKPTRRASFETSDKECYGNRDAIIQIDDSDNEEIPNIMAERNKGLRAVEVESNKPLSNKHTTIVPAQQKLSLIHI